MVQTGDGGYQVSGTRLRDGQLPDSQSSVVQNGIHTSWWTLRQELSTHQVVTVVMPTTDGRVLRIRKGTVAEPTHREIYSTLGIPMQVIPPENLA